MADYLVWIDCEMTGLDLRRDALIEVAALVTDAELTVLGEGVDVVVKPYVDQVRSGAVLTFTDLDRGVSLGEA